MIAAYVDALITEIAYVAAYQSLRIHTIYFGGGTPSLLPPQQVGRILEAIAQHMRIQPNCEITLEANPGTIDLAYFRALRATGVNRLSLGMQSAHDQELQMYGRLHDASAISQALHDARQARFDNISLDLIYAAPHQTRDMWQHSLQTAIDPAP